MSHITLLVWSPHATDAILLTLPFPRAVFAPIAFISNIGNVLVIGGFLFLLSEKYFSVVTTSSSIVFCVKLNHRQPHSFCYFLQGGDSTQTPAGYHRSSDAAVQKYYEIRHAIRNTSDHDIN